MDWINHNHHMQRTLNCFFQIIILLFLYCCNYPD